MADNNRAIHAALAGNAAIAATKFGAAAFTGSASMASEGVHSLVDTINQLLLLHGKRRARRRPDKLHPFGYGRELYFWTFVVAIMVFALGALVSIHQGIVQLRAPAHVEKPLVNYLVLAAALLFEGLSWRVGYREFRASLRPGERLWQALRGNQDLSLLAVLIEDTAAILGLLIAATGLALSQWLDLPALDGVASLLIGGLLALAAYALGTRSRDLLVGEAADRSLVEALLAAERGSGDPACQRRAHQLSRAGCDDGVAERRVPRRPCHSRHRAGDRADRGPAARALPADPGRVHQAADPRKVGAPDRRAHGIPRCDGMRQAQGRQRRGVMLE